MDEIILPGEKIPELEKGATKLSVVGPGLRKTGDEIVSFKAGLLKRKDNKHYIDNYQKRYIPVRGDTVIGVVTAKAGDVFRVDIGAHELASLSYSAFEGATKKNRPDVSPGDVLYARLLVAGTDVEPELVCVNSLGKKGKLGVLSGGFLFNCSLNLARKILQSDDTLLQKLKNEIPFECAIGLNGKIWIKAKNIRETIATGNAILAYEYLKTDDSGKLCDKIGNMLFANY